ncbi:unnamed protein product [Dracunculus medinensis]|uniref:Reverse transcriptase domain-containing protein n=1 Tax=Dracunculus medinensis TaxID=318479 RepID=A0A0N4UA67_DRAME|nr:unnamed protein product [Dracunculus medinensis]
MRRCSREDNSTHKEIYELTLVQIYVYGELTDSFEIKTGVRQGCVLSPTIFNYAIDWVMDTACRHSRGVQISPEHHITDLEYANNVVFFADSVFAFHHKMPLFMNSLSIEEVHDFKYLGSTLIPNGQAKNDIITRITVRNALFGLTKHLWSHREITIRTKVRIYIAMIDSVLLYGCKTWPMRRY